MISNKDLESIENEPIFSSFGKNIFKYINILILDSTSPKINKLVFPSSLDDGGNLTLF